MGAEAEALLQMAATDDPAQATSPDNAALTAIAALLAHRVDEAGGLDDRRLPVTDDIELWRAYRQTQLQPHSPSAAAQLAATLPLLLSYPPEMRRRMLPVVAEALVEGGEIDAAAALLNARKADGSLDLARGMLEQAKGDTDAALAIYDRLAQSRDQQVYARAAVHAVDLRLAAGQIDAHEAAERLDRLQSHGEAIISKMSCTIVWWRYGNNRVTGGPRSPCCARTCRCRLIILHCAPG